MNVAAVIPARYASTRLPGKPLLEIAGKPMIQWVVERVRRARTVGQVLVATDDPRIVEAVRAFGGRAVLTSADHPSGTDRIAEAVRGLDAAVVVNVQGDEPLIHPAVVDACVRPLLEGEEAPVVTACVPIASAGVRDDPAVVKVVRDLKGYALYFSRSVIPLDRDGEGVGPWYKHLGLYAYRREFLLEYVGWEPTPLERTERLEQLRVLERGFRIRVVTVEHDSVAVDTPEALAAVRGRMAPGTTGA